MDDFESTVVRRLRKRQDERDFPYDVAIEPQAMVELRLDTGEAYITVPRETWVVRDCQEAFIEAMKKYAKKHCIDIRKVNARVMRKAERYLPPADE